MNRRMAGAAPITKAARLVSKQGVRAPRRTVTSLTTDEWGVTWGVFSCGHITNMHRSRSSVLGFKGACYACQEEKAEQMEREQHTGR